MPLRVILGAQLDLQVFLPHFFGVFPMEVALFPKVKRGVMYT
jgi:hypothetical protein